MPTARQSVQGDFARGEPPVHRKATPVSHRIGDLYAPSPLAARPSRHRAALCVVCRARRRRLAVARRRTAVRVGREQRRDVRERLRRALQPRDLVRRPDRLDGAVRICREHVLVGDHARGHGRARPRLPRAARFGRYERHRAARGRCDRDVEPRGDRWEGRSRQRSDPALVRRDRRLVRGLGGCRRLRRLRHGSGLRRRRRSAGSRRHVGDRPRGRRLHRHRFEHGRLLDDRRSHRSTRPRRPRRARAAAGRRRRSPVRRFACRSSP